MTRWLIPLLLLTLLAFRSPADDPPPVGKKAEENAKTVAKNLLAHLTPLPGVGWEDFQLRVVDRIGESEYATAAGWEQWADGKENPYVKITTGFLRMYGNNPDALAVLIGRECGSLVLGHVPRKGVEFYPGGACANRRRQTDADLFAAELLLKSGYSLQFTIMGLKRDLDKLPDAVRPAMAERIDRLAKLLDPGEELWRLMPAFDTGLVFRAIQQYPLAELCFASVFSEFPQCHEAWVLLTVSRLMRYRSHLGPKPVARKPLVVTLANGKTVAVGDDSDETVTKLGRPSRTTQAVPRSRLVRLWFEAHGIEVFAETDEVFVVVLTSKGPQVKVPGADGKPAGSLRVGMTRKAVESLPGCADSALRPFLPSRPGVCAYYPALGVAVVYDRDGLDGVVTSVIVGDAGR